MLKKLKNLILCWFVFRAKYWLMYKSGVILGFNVKVYPFQHVTLGARVFIGRGVTISTSASGRSPISIGSDVMLAQEVMIIGGNHQFESKNIPINQQGEGIQGAVVIEDDVWVGARAIVLTGVHIGRGAIVGAGSVVTKDIGPYEIWAGNPARLLRVR